jgi:hypothetical protein
VYIYVLYFGAFKLLLENSAIMNRRYASELKEYLNKSLKKFEDREELESHIRDLNKRFYPDDINQYFKLFNSKGELNF